MALAVQGYPEAARLLWLIKAIILLGKVYRPDLKRATRLCWRTLLVLTAISSPAGYSCACRIVPLRWDWQCASYQLHFQHSGGHCFRRNEGVCQRLVQAAPY